MVPGLSIRKDGIRGQGSGVGQTPSSATFFLAGGPGKSSDFPVPQLRHLHHADNRQRCCEDLSTDTHQVCGRPVPGTWSVLPNWQSKRGVFKVTQ